MAPTVPITRRPVGVWLITVFYLLSAGWTLLSFALIFSGSIKKNPAQAAYFASLTRFDLFFSLCIAAFSVGGAISLILLRRIAVVLFSIALGLNLVLTAVHAIFTSYIAAMGGSGLLGVFLGWLILVVVIAYARALSKRGVLS